MGKVFQLVFEEDEVDLLGDESAHWCEVSECVRACFCFVCACSVFACEIGGSSDVETVEPQAFSFSKKRDASVAGDEAVLSFAENACDEG